MFPDYKFITKESGPLHTDQYCNNQLTVEHQRVDEETGNWIGVMQSTCELLLVGRETNLERPTSPTQALYAVVPAHQVLSGEQCDQLSRTTNSALISEIREQVNSQITNTKYILDAFDHHFKVDLKQPPMIAFRKKYKNISTETTGDPNWRCSWGTCTVENVSACPHSCMNDIALFQVDAQAVRELRSQIQSLLGPGNLFDRIAPFKMEHVERMREGRRRIYIGDVPVRLIKSYKTAGENPEEEYADHISFVPYKR